MSRCDRLTRRRQYHKYRNGRYPIPNDDTEQNRDDMKHAMMLELTESVALSCAAPGTLG